MVSSPPSRAKRRYLVIPLVIGVLLLGGYGVLWLYGKDLMRKEIDKFVAAERAEGREVQYADMSIRGFPMALRAQFDDFTWEDPGVWSWSGETLHLITMPHDLGRLILAPRGPQQLTQNGRPYAVTPNDLRVGMSEERYNLEATDVVVEGEEGVLDIGGVKGQWTAGDTGAWVFGAEARGVAYQDPDERTALLPGLNIAASHAAGQGDAFTIDGAQLGFDDGSDGQPTLITLAGDLGVGPQGYPAGALDVTVRNEAKLIGLLERFDILDAGQRPAIEQTLATMRSDDGETAARFRMRNGGLFLGFIRIAELPQLR